MRRKKERSKQDPINKQGKATQHICTYDRALRHGIVLSAVDSSTLNSSAMDSSAMDSSTIGVGVAVLVGKCMQGPCSAVPDIRNFRI